MNRFTHAFAAALPSSASDASGSHPSPAESHFADHGTYQHGTTTAIYDDPRSTHFNPPLTWGSAPSLSLPKRPGLPRHITEDGSGRMTPRATRDPGVRANLMSAQQQWKKAWGGGSNCRLAAMAEGTEGRYAVGGAQYLRILQVTIPESGSSTPTTDKPKTPNRVQQVLARGPGGTQVSEVANLWKTGWAVGKGVNDIDWGVGSMENKIVTANPNGNFLVFDVVKARYEKEVSGGHPRPMNVLRFCKIPAYSYLLLTGGTDGIVKLWDMREREPTSRKSFKHACPVTSICFSPNDPDHFAIGLEQGGLHRYDLRARQKGVGRIWGAHGNKAIMDLKWKASSEHDAFDGSNRAGWLASAGADRKVRIWDMSQSWAEKAVPLHTLHTAHPLRRVSWRPGHETEILTVPSSQPTVSGSIDPTIASITSGLGTQMPVHETDAHLEVWDVRRHYVAKYGIASSDGVAVDAVWSDEGNIVTAFQDGAFSQLSLKGSELPLEQVPRQVMAWNAKGEMAYAVDRFKEGEVPFDDLKQEFASHWDKVGRQSKTIADHPYEPLQACGVVPVPEDDEDEFAYMAHHYKLEGKAPEQLCQWNREVAEICGRPDDARLWTYLKVLIEEFAPSADGSPFNEEIFSGTLPAPSQFLPQDIVSPGDSHPSTREPSPIRGNARVATIPLERAVDTLVDTSQDAVEELLSSTSSSSTSSDASATPSKGRFVAFLPPDIRNISDSQPRLPSTGSSGIPSSLSRRGTFQTLFTQAVTQSQSQQSQNTQQQQQQQSGRDHSSPASSSDIDYPDPYGIGAATTTAVPTRHSSADRSHTATSSVGADSRDRSGSVTKSRSSPLPGQNHHQQNGSNRPLASQGPTAEKKVAIVPATAKDRETQFGADEWEAYRRKRCEVLKDWWQTYINDGEVQMATAVFVIGSCLFEFPSRQCERIVHTYIDLLERYRLTGSAAYIRKHAGIASLETLSTDEGVTHIVHCARCGKSTGSLDDIGIEAKRFWWCKRCLLTAHKCAICHQGVKGIWMGCSRCRHGGHSQCMRLYYHEAPVVPTSNDKNTTNSRPTLDPIQSTATSIAGTSHESSGFVERTRTRDTEVSVNGGGLVDGYTVCPAGCGCKCRRVNAGVEGEPG
ncbi:hypothetical protein BCR39DRAFT_513871 [Naematelia encephala]|uniref:Uncharacterized protein n=1 Tax=Naematelia encephala TaxID=71784 RepID=A0A1Y2BIP9_9TREE|nr:hypothetical protein BCR39DRAFT_513871 [Naematelia encephala]